jgi:hypothetical protein
LRPELLPQVTETHQESLTYVFVFVSGCVVAPNNPPKWPKKDCDDLKQLIGQKLNAADSARRDLNEQIGTEMFGEAWSTAHLVVSEGFQLGTSVAALGKGLVGFLAGRVQPWIAMNGKTMSDYAQVTNRGNAIDAARGLIGDQVGDAVQSIVEAGTIQAAGRFIDSFGDALNHGEGTMNVARHATDAIQKSFNQFQSEIGHYQAQFNLHCK